MSHGPRWLAGPPWSSDHGRPWAPRSWAIWLLWSMGARCDEVKREGSNAVLTKGFNDWGKGGVRLAAERTIDVGSCTMMNRMGHAEDKLEMV
jgi:hypothetical protein